MKSIVTFALALSWFLTLMLPTDARLNDRLNDIWNAIKNIYDAVDNDDEEVRVIIGYRNDTIKRDRLISKILSKIQSQFDSADAFAAVMKRSDLLALKNDPDIDYIEEDVMVYPDGETKLYGLDMVQATSLLIPAVPGATSACNDPSSFKIGVSCAQVERKAFICYLDISQLII